MERTILALVRALAFAGALALAGGCGQSSSTKVSVTLIQSDDAAADAMTSYDAADGGGAALCCSVPRVLTGLEMYDPNYYSPYHNVLVNGTPRQQAYATCDQLSSWPGPMRPGSNPTQAQIDLYMSEFMSGPDIAVVMPCWDAPEPNSSYGRWQCGGDAGQAAECMNSGWSCGEGSTCWFDPGGTSGYGCTGTVTKCTVTPYTPPPALSDSGAG
jgi:hypothetical protein